MDDQLFLLLVARKLSGEATSQELRQLEELMAKNPGYQERFAAIRSFWDTKTVRASRLDAAYEKVLENAKASEQTGEQETPASKKVWRLSPVYRRLSAAAAVLIAITLVAYLLINTKPASDLNSVAARQVEQTPKGTRTSLTLADGTKVVLNADSRLEFPRTFDSAIREVYLTGEAYFDVTHNPAKPFLIHAGKMNIRVLGTEFNVRAYPDDSTSEATLIHGMIEVTVQDRPNNTFILKPTEKLVLVNHPAAQTGSETVQTPHPATRLSIENLHYMSPSDSAIVETVWLKDKFVFRDESFQTIAKGLERKYNVTILFRNNDVKQYRFTGAFDHEKIEDVFKALSLTEPFQYQIQSDTITIE